MNLAMVFPGQGSQSVGMMHAYGDIAAVRGTRVIVEVTPTIQPAGASLVVGGRDTVPLALEGTSVLAGQLTVERPSSYRVLFQTAAAIEQAAGRYQAPKWW